jgi:signal transduction histidine kinase
MPDKATGPGRSVVPEEDDGGHDGRYGSAVDGGTWERLRRVDPRIWDALLALVVGVVTLLAYGIPGNREHEAGVNALGIAIVVAVSVPLAWRRLAPLVVVAIVAIGVVVFAVTEDQAPLLLPVMVSLYAAAAERDRSQAAPVLIPAAIAMSLAMYVPDAPLGRTGFNWIEALASFVVSAGVPIALGRMAFNRRRRIARGRELAAREAVTAERVRIARELHDVVAHHLSVMVVQAGAARAVRPTDPEAADEALRQVEAAGRTGLGEMRRLLDVLTEGDAAADAREPQPGLERLDALLESVRAAGLPVERVVATRAGRTPRRRSRSRAR